MKTTAYRLDHVGIAVASIEESLEIYRALGLRESGRRETVESQGVVTAFLPVGETRLELLQPTGEDSPVARFLAKRGPGVHHLAYRVDDVAGALVRLRDEGITPIDEVPRRGSRDTLIAFVHPKDMEGVLVELVQVP